MYIVTYTGVRLKILEGIPTLADIAINHCRTPMFAGHTEKFYSVAHHCLAAAKLAEVDGPIPTLLTLLHEAEVVAYGDIPGPMKTDEQRKIERDFRSRLFTYIFGGDFSHIYWPRVEYWDKIEQAASATWLGFKEPIHFGVWGMAGEEEQKRAIKVTQDLYHKFPPESNLDKGNLYLEFMVMAIQYAQQLRLKLE